MIIETWWQQYGFGPSIDDIMRLTGEKGRGNVCRKMRALVDLGLCKGIKGRHRSIRPSYMRLRNHE